MSDEPHYLNDPDDIDMEAEEWAIRIAGLKSMVLLVVAVPGAYYGFPHVVDFPTELVDRLGFAVVASVFVLIWVVVGVLLVSTTRRGSPEDIGGSAAGPPSQKLAIYAAFLQNTLEQAVIAVGVYLAVAVVVSGPWLSLILVGVIFFGVGRVLFLAGYQRGAQGRALGMTLTMLPTLLGYLLVVVLVVLRLV